MSLALAIIVIDTSLLNVSLKTIINDLKTNIESMQWVITAYTLILSAFAITGGRLGDLFGRKRMFILGAIIFAIGSFVASISKNVGMMIVGEAVIEGIGAALMDWAMAEFTLQHADEVQLSVYSENVGAQRFYARYGFVKVADISFRVGEHVDAEFLLARLL